MHFPRLIYAAFLANCLITGTAIAADTAPAAATKSSQLDMISPAPAKLDHIDCPMHHGNKISAEEHGKPCPHHEQGEHENLQKKCDHDHPG